MQVRVLSTILLFQFIPDFSTFFHGFSMGTAFFFLDLIDIFSGVEKICWKRFFREQNIFTVFLLWVNIEVSTFLAIYSHEEAIFFKFLKLSLVSFFILFAFGLIWFLFIILHTLPDLSRFSKRSLLVHILLLFQLCYHLSIEIDPSWSSFLWFSNVSRLFSLFFWSSWLLGFLFWGSRFFGFFLRRLIVFHMDVLIFDFES